MSVIVIVIVISLEYSTVVVGVFKFKFEYPIYSILEKSLIVLGLFHYKYCSEYLLCGRLQWEPTAVESLNFLTLWTKRRKGLKKKNKKLISKKHRRQMDFRNAMHAQ